MTTTKPHNFEDTPESAYLTYTTQQGFEIVCAVCDGAEDGHRDYVSDDAARHLYAAYEQH